MVSLPQTRIILFLVSGQIDGAGHNVSNSLDRGGRYCETTDRIGSGRWNSGAKSRINRRPFGAYNALGAGGPTLIERGRPAVRQ